MNYMFKKPIKIDFPEEEYLSLMDRDIIVTHRVSDEFSLYMHLYTCSMEAHI